MNDDPAATPERGSAEWYGALFTVEFAAESALCAHEECGDPIERLPESAWITVQDRFPAAAGTAWGGRRIGRLRLSAASPRPMRRSSC
ncbi:hypothetical protein [Cryptosporangium sp. NPDC048952]|uniref:hypothetical protein n=1 Tax=Cryptosporangium sp. NPDC048952 TaxID=3363961 RepID=UPI00371AE3F1